MTYDEAVNWLLAHGPLEIGRTGAEARERWKEILDVVGFRQLQQNYDEACAELAKKAERLEWLDGLPESYEKETKALRQIAERGCRHCSAGNRAMSALGWTYIPEDNHEDQLIAERDAARTLADQLGHFVQELSRRKNDTLESLYVSIANEHLAKDCEPFVAAWEARSWR